MIMDVPSVEVGADYYLEFSTEKLLRKFQPDLMGQLRRDLPGSEASAPDESPALLSSLCHTF